MTDKVNWVESPKQFKSEAERHAWNQKLSEQLDMMDDARSPEEQEKACSYLRGGSQIRKYLEPTFVARKHWKKV